MQCWDLSSQSRHRLLSFLDMNVFRKCSWLKWYTLTYLINGHARLFISEKFSTLDTLIKAYPFISFWKNFLPPRLLKPTLLLIHLKFPSSPFSRIEIQFSRRHFQYKQTIKRPFNTYMTVKWALIFDRRCESSWFCSQIEIFY